MSSAVIPGLVTPPSSAPPPDLIAELLAGQRDLTPVDRFSRAHDAERLPDLDARYRELIPSAAPAPGQQYAFEVDLDACSGCKACVVACHSLNGLDEGESWRRVGTVVSGPLPLVADGPVGTIDPIAGLATPARPTEVGCGTGSSTAGDAPPASGGCGSGGCGCGPGEVSPVPGTSTDDLGPLPVIQHVTSACHHCVDPACMNGCPVDAYEKDPVTGIVRHHDDQCIGCTYCQFTCPYEVPVFNAGRGIVRKCDMCIDRLEVGEAPACVGACPTEAIRIRLIDVASAAAPTSEWPLPNTPSRNLTKPTTSYLTTRSPAEDAHAADVTAIRPGHSHTPLAIMLVLTQLSVGAFTIDLLLRAIGLRPSAAGSLTALAFGVVALVASTFHLGRPLQAWKAWIGLRHSWLSREIVAFGIYAGLVATFAVTVDLFGLLTGAIAVALGAVAAATGALGVACSVLIYAVTGREAWRLPTTAARFVGTTLATGLVVTTAVEAATGGPSWLVRGLAVTGGIAVVAHTVAELAVLRHRHDRTSNRGRTAVLLARDLRGQVIVRSWMAVLGGLVMPTLVVAVAAALAEGVAAAVFASVGVVVVVVGEVLARRLYFSTSVSPSMPGGLP